MSTACQHRTWSELAVRENDGLAVSLFWSKATDRVRVVVVDQISKERLHLDVPAACALDAYHHPFAYAAGRGHEASCAISEPFTPSDPERSAA